MHVAITLTEEHSAYNYTIRDLTKFSLKMGKELLMCKIKLKRKLGNLSNANTPY